MLRICAFCTNNFYAPISYNDPQWIIHSKYALFPGWVHYIYHTVHNIPYNQIDPYKQTEIWKVIATNFKMTSREKFENWWVKRLIQVKFWKNLWILILRVLVSLIWNSIFGIKDGTF